MMNKKVCKVSSDRHLPSDMLPEILSRLPVKSLLRFRCVSKPWLSLVDDAGFARLHLKNFKNNRNETHLLVFEGRERNCVLRCSETFETNSETLYTLGFVDDPERWEIIGFVHGLILLKLCSDSSDSYDQFSVLKIWNTSIRKFHEVPSLPEIEGSPNSSFRVHNIGLGYDQSANDYKIVILIVVKDNPLHSVAVYTVGVGSWKIIPFQGKGPSCSKWRWVPYRHITGLFFQGRLYFIAMDTEKDESLRDDLISFDLSSEVFSFISNMPQNPFCWSFDYKLGLVDNGCSLALLDNSTTDVKSVWVLKSCSSECESMYWTKRYSLCMESTALWYLKKNGEILTWRRRGQTFTNETGKQESEIWNDVASYNPEADKNKILQQKRGNEFSIRHVFGYIESLIMHK